MGDKNALRRHFREWRDGTPEPERAAASRSLCRELALFCSQREITRLGAFWPYGSEIDLRSLVQGHPEWTFYFPRVVSVRPPRLQWGQEPLEPGRWGLLEPSEAPHHDPPVQLLLVPGLAFDPRGFRLGYGGGFYDTTLAQLPEGILTLALGFECQRCGPLPVEPQDLPVQALLTEAGLSWF